VLIVRNQQGYSVQAFARQKHAVGKKVALGICKFGKRRGSRQINGCPPLGDREHVDGEVVPRPSKLKERQANSITSLKAEAECEGWSNGRDLAAQGRIAGRAMEHLAYFSDVLGLDERLSAAGEGRYEQCNEATSHTRSSRTAT
jgi:hypothetical protein